MDNQIQPAPFSVQQDYAKKKNDLELAFKEFHKLISDKVLNENKSTAMKKTESQTVENLVRAAQALDMVNVGDGILALATIAIREQLMVRDRVNELEYELCKAMRDIDKLNTKVFPENAKKPKRKA